MGATGHVGSATARTLLEQGEAVTVVTRDAEKACNLRALGAEVAVADVHDIATMRDVFRLGRRLFLLNPPAAPDTDTDRVEKETVRHLLAALDGSGLEKIVAESTYGAQAGDLNALYDMEQGLGAQPIPYRVIRAAYYMSNWDMMAASARESGTLPTMYPADLKIPMVAPADLGRVAARLLVEPAGHTGIQFVEGPERYCSTDVAHAFANALGKPVNPLVTPRSQWESTYRQLGFSEPAAKSYARMTGVSVDGNFEMPENPIRGTITLQAHVDALCSKL
ncbi:MAG: NmrA family NAD(P)-binding protein [Rhizorhabdus sp.]